MNGIKKKNSQGPAIGLFRNLTGEEGGRLEMKEVDGLPLKVEVYAKPMSLERGRTPGPFDKGGRFPVDNPP